MRHSLPLLALAASVLLLSCQPPSLLEHQGQRGSGQQEQRASSPGRDIQSSQAAPETAHDLSRAEQLLADDKLEEAVAILQRVVAQAPGHLRARLLLGGALLELGKSGEAQAALSTAVDAWPHSAEAHLLLGYALLEHGERPAAVQQLQQALALITEPEQLVSAHLGLAATYEALQEHALANRHYAEALTIAPELREVLVHIQKALLWRGQAMVNDAPTGATRPGSTRRARIAAEVQKILKEHGK
jgi:tetratricopeptide (TPR) repeat protein